MISSELNSNSQDRDEVQKDQKESLKEDKVTLKEDKENSVEEEENKKIIAAEEEKNSAEEEKNSVEEDVEEDIQASFITLLNQDRFKEKRIAFLDKFKKVTIPKEINKKIQDKVSKSKVSKGIDKKMLSFNIRLAMQQALSQHMDQNNVSRFLYALSRGIELSKEPTDEEIESIFDKAIEELPKQIDRIIDGIYAATLAQMEMELEKIRQVSDLKKENKQQKELLKKYSNRIRQLERDFENLRNRFKKQEELYMQQQTAKMFEQLIPVLDHIERALNELEDKKDDSIVRGFILIAQEFHLALEKLGLKRIETVGKICDYNLHEILIAEETSEYEDNEIIEELKPGYMYKDKIIRTAGVKVAINHAEQRTTKDDQVQKEEISTTKEYGIEESKENQEEDAVNSSESEGEKE